MTSPPVTANGLFENYREKLELRWLAGQAGGEKTIIPEKRPGDDLSLIGHLNFIYPHRIQVLGASELDYLRGLGKNSYEDALKHLFGGDCGMVILTADEPPPERMREMAETSAVPLLGSTLSSEKLIDHLSYYLSKMLAEKVVVHGVFIDVMGIGVLLTGEAAVGKSELALELITRGHYLVADDAPEFVATAPDTLQGHCPEALRDFLEVRGLGVLNIRAMFGDSAIKRTKILRLVVHLMPMERCPLNELDRLRGNRNTRRILDVDVPEILLPVAPGRNLAVLVEAAARHHVLLHHGYDAAEDFISRQQRIMEEKAGP